MQPLIISGEDVFERIADGTIELAQGIRVEMVEPDSVADQSGLRVDDEIVAVNGEPIVVGEELLKQIDDPGSENVIVDIQRQGTDGELERTAVQLVPREGKSLGFAPYQMMFLPRLVIEDVQAESESARAGLRAGDVILSLNGEDVYYMEEFEFIHRGAHELSYHVLRSGEERTVNVELPKDDLVVVSTVYPGTPAHEANIQQGDIITEVNGLKVSTPEQITEAVRSDSDRVNSYEIKRGDQSLTIPVKPEDGLIGVGLTVLNAFDNRQLSVYALDVPTSVLEIKDIRYPLWIAPFRAFEETGRLSVLTVGMFGNVFKTVITQLAVPEGVAGPVGIAQLTHIFVQEGLLSVMRFVALISLSLAILNIFPFPALDGGRVFFVLAEVIVGRRVSPKVETIIHAVGFVVLMLIIVLVTFSDIMRLF